MTIEMSIKIKDEKITHTAKEHLHLPLDLSKDNRELVEKVASVYAQFVHMGCQQSAEAPEITLKFKMIWQL
jgi:hypothetical protein